jgi:hypothetical protein
VGAGLAWANSQSEPIDPGRLTLGLRAVVVSGCGYRLSFGKDVVALRLCALFEAGVLAIRPYGFTEPTSPDRPWFALGPLLRLEMPIPSTPVVLRGDAGIAFPFERERGFAVSGPIVEVVAPVGLRFAVGAFLRVF